MNSVRRDIVLEQTLVKCPEMFPMLRQSYSVQTPLFTRTDVMYSSTSLQQGDPLFSSWNALALVECICPKSSEFNLLFMEDEALGGVLEAVANELVTLREKVARKRYIGII